MAVKTGIHWIKPPADLEKALQQYGVRAKVFVHALGAHFGGLMQNDARDNVPWEDRSGNARGGIFFAVDGLGLAGKEGETKPAQAAAFRRDAREDTGPGGNARTLVVVLGHTMFYGEFLELAHGEKYAILWPTMQAYIPKIEKALRDLFK